MIEKDELQMLAGSAREISASAKTGEELRVEQEGAHADAARRMGIVLAGLAQRAL